MITEIINKRIEKIKNNGIRGYNYERKDVALFELNIIKEYAQKQDELFKEAVEIIKIYFKWHQNILDVADFFDVKDSESETLKLRIDKFLEKIKEVIE